MQYVKWGDMFEYRKRFVCTCVHVVLSSVVVSTPSLSPPLASPARRAFQKRSRNSPAAPCAYNERSESHDSFVFTALELAEAKYQGHTCSLSWHKSVSTAVNMRPKPPRRKHHGLYPTLGGASGLGQCLTVE